MKNKGMQLGSLLVAMLLLSMAFVPAASAQNGSTTPTNNEVNITGPHVVFFNVSDLKPLENRQRLILQGNKTSTGCQYPTIMLKITKDEGNIAKVIRELAVNPDTCQQLVEQGTFYKPSENPNPLSEKIIISQNSAPLSLQGLKQATMTTTWYDPLPYPLTLKVNNVSDQINFNYDGNYVYPNSPGFDHWWNIYTDFLFTTTNVYYQPNTVFGFPDGSVGGSSNTWAEGSIRWMLHYEKILS